MSRHATPTVHLDFETTGGVANHDRVLEIGLIRVEEGRTREWETLVNPERPMPEIVKTLTGLADADLASAPLFSEVIDTLDEFVRGATVIAHNAPFEREFLRAEFERLGREPPYAQYVCTRRISGVLWPELPKHSMDVVADHAGLKIAGRRHRALSDARLTLALWNLWRTTTPKPAFEAAIRSAFV